MRAKLIKNPEGYDTPYILTNMEDILIASTEGKLSIKNCQAIELGYDLDELALEAFELDLNCQGDCNNYYERLAYKLGMIKMIGLLGNKKFSEGDMEEAFADGQLNQLHNQKYFSGSKAYIQSLQQTEWDVWLVMACGLPDGCTEPEVSCTCDIIPSLDADGCLILKRIKE